MNFDMIRELTKEEQSNYTKEMKLIRDNFKKHIVPEKYPETISNIHNILLSIKNQEIMRDQMIELSS
ncbi:hypothetical protein [Lacrimispora amygdalina]|uniref:hypothetical protein n=1 Tax=Lacrimispora amygdalina TaxID=253257 RepID=UPI000BE2AD38|nr:hypothetical protein [Lacrimispora amygdalina]